ncbi:MAG: peptidase domain-containing ABC transporter [Geminicoccaceae bacterium]|nr:peptidase domain-containing ABC transporter [Geminicoccaceae bacterium]
MSGLREQQANAVPEPQGDALLAGFLALCGQFDLAMGEAELRATVPVPAEGADASTLRRLAERLDLSFERHTPGKKRLEELAPPYLLQGAHGDAWLVRGRANRHLILVDPLRSETRAVTPRTAAELATSVLVLRPRRAGAAEVAGQGLWQRAVAARLKPALLEIALASVFINLMALATPIFMMTVYNKVVAQAAVRTLDVLAIGMLSLFAFELLLRGLRGHIVGHTGAKLDLALSSEVVHHLLALPHRVFERVPSGQMLERLRQLDQLRSFLTGNLPLLLVDLAFVGLFLAAIFLLSPMLGMVTACAMPLFVLVSAVAHRRQKALVKQNFRAVAGKASSLAETVAQAYTVKSLGLEQEMERRFDARQIESAWTGFKAAGLANLVGAGGQALQHLTGLVVVYLGAQMIISGELSIGALVACTILSARALSPMRQLFFAYAQLQQVRDAFTRLDQLLGEHVERRAGTMPAPSNLAGHIRLENVSFAYAEGKPPALDGLDLDVAPGTMLAIVGPPGSGKSTLAKLISGLEHPTSGRILIDHLDLARLSPASYRAQIGMVPQEVQLFSGSIAENIAMGATDRSITRIVAAARFVGLHDLVQRLPEGYDTILGERGSGLSLGQRQLVSIARAIVRNPRLLILDEATSALDAASETHLLGNLRRAGSGRTIVLITHRRSVAEMCDRAVFLQQGRSIAQGTPGEVLHAADRHARLEAREAAVGRSQSNANLQAVPS